MKQEPQEPAYKREWRGGSAPRMSSLWRDRERAHGSHAARGLALARGTQFARGSWSSAARHRAPPPEPQYKLVMTTSARMLWRKNRELAPLLAAPAHERHGQKSAWKVCQLADVSGSGQARGESTRHRGGSHRRVRGRRKACTAAGKAAPALSPSSKDVARMKENVITAENAPEQNVSGQGARESGTSLQTQCGRASQHTRSVDAADSAFNISSMTF